MPSSSRRLLRAVLASTLLGVFASCVQRALVVDTYPTGSGGVNAAHQVDKPYLVLVSIDAFRWDYLERYPTPNLHRIADAGFRAGRLVPVFPTLTFPNHYSIATGLYPEHHGLVGNDFPDPASGKWYALRDRNAVQDGYFYGGEPMWVTAESQGMVAASFFFVGSEAPIKGIQPTHWRPFDGKISNEHRVDQVLNWLAEPPQRRPHLLTLYFEEVDNHAHWYGPDADETAAAVSRVDTQIGRLLDGVEALPHGGEVNIVVVSDHGQAAYKTGEDPFFLEGIVDIGDAVIVEGGAYLFMYLDENQQAADIARAINSKWQHGRAYPREQAPPGWRIGSNPRFPDVILMPETGYGVLSTPGRAAKITAGDHGWAPGDSDMHGIFIAAGPAIRRGAEIEAASVVDVYPLILAILGLEGPAEIDGDQALPASILQTAGN